MDEIIRESKVLWMIERFANDAEFTAEQPYATTVFMGNIALNTGINELWKLACGTGGVQFSNDNAVLGVGDSDAAAAATQTGLQANTNKAYALMDDGYPTYGTSQQATWRATFGSTEANFDWNEFVVANGQETTSITLNRKVSDQGTKAAGSTWRLSVTITLA